VVYLLGPNETYGCGSAAVTIRRNRLSSRRNRTERSRRHAADLAPTIEVLWEAGVTSPVGIAAELTRLGIPTPAGSSEWRAAQVTWVLLQLRWAKC
jgi:hypothetical protein